MALQQIVEDSVGTRIQFNLQTKDVNDVLVPFNLTDATATLLLKAPTTAAIARSCVVIQPPTLGQAYYDTIDGDIPASSQGTWKAQMKVVLGTNRQRTPQQEFVVLPKLD